MSTDVWQTLAIYLNFGQCKCLTGGTCCIFKPQCTLDQCRCLAGDTCIFKTQCILVQYKFVAGDIGRTFKSHCISDQHSFMADDSGHIFKTHYIISISIISTDVWQMTLVVYFKHHVF